MTTSKISKTNALAGKSGMEDFVLDFFGPSIIIVQYLEDTILRLPLNRQTVLVQSELKPLHLQQYFHVGHKILDAV